MLKLLSPLGCSPRMWRWSCDRLVFRPKILVFSTYVEMILNSKILYQPRRGVLHVCGDDPSTSLVAKSKRLCSPRMWRWSLIRRLEYQCGLVFSTYVEMILAGPQSPLIACCVLHVCGDDPCPTEKPNANSKCSPRMWRWSWTERCKSRRLGVFSTYVEMILNVI